MTKAYRPDDYDPDYGDVAPPQPASRRPDVSEGTVDAWKMAVSEVRPNRPRTHRVDIVMNDGEVGSIHMDGRDVGQCATSAVVFLQPGRGPKVVLELSPEALGIRSDSADVEMGTGTYGLLRQLGWVPPAAPQVPVASERKDVQD